VLTTVRNGGANAPPKDGGATVCRTFAEAWADLALLAFTATTHATSARWGEPATPNAGSGGLNVRRRGGVAAGSGTCADCIPASRSPPKKKRPGGRWVKNKWPAGRVKEAARTQKPLPMCVATGEGLSAPWSGRFSLARARCLKLSEAR